MLIAPGVRNWEHTPQSQERQLPRFAPPGSLFGDSLFGHKRTNPHPSDLEEPHDPNHAAPQRGLQQSQSTHPFVAQSGGYVPLFPVPLFPDSCGCSCFVIGYVLSVTWLCVGFVDSFLFCDTA
jgi:hypothetical protein